MKKEQLTALAAVVLMLAIPQWLAAEQQDYAAGKVAGPLLAVGLGARPAGMAEAFTAVANDYHATLYNPAGLAFCSQSQAGMLHAFYLEQTAIEYAGAVYKTGKQQAVGLSAAYLNYGSIDKLGIDSNGQPEALGSFSPFDLLVAGSFSHGVLSFLSAGLTVKYFQQTIDTVTYSTLAGDVGVLMQPGLMGLTAAVVIKNVGTPIADFNLPLKAVVAAAYTLPVKITEKDQWLVDVDLDVPLGEVRPVAVKMGTEYWYNHLLALRAGYKLSDKGGLDDTTGLTVGAGLAYGLIQIDYALVSFGELGLTHQMALSLNF